jgi:hypothetical protein
MNMFRKSKLVFGLSVTLVILCSGCTTTRPMGYNDVNYYQIDCSKKNEQVAMLNSMRSDRDDRAMAKLRNIFQPWLPFTNPTEYANNYYQGTGRTDAYINYKAQDLSDSCQDTVRGKQR